MGLKAVVGAVSNRDELGLANSVIVVAKHPHQTLTLSQPGQAGIEYCRLKIEDLWYRFALSFLCSKVTSGGHCPPY